MMEVVADAGAQQPWDQFKEEVEIMEEENGGGGGAEELLTREIKKRLLGHAHGSSNGNGNGNGAHHANGREEEEEEGDHANGGEKEDHANGEEEEEEVKVDPEEAEELHKSILFDPSKVPDIITEVSARYLVTGTMRSGAEKEDTNGTLTPKGKGLEAHENGNAHETNHGSSNGKLENGSHSNGSHQAPNGAEPNIENMFEINKTEIYPTDDDKVEHVIGTQPKVEEYDLQKILDKQETHDLYCPNCNSCITRRVILKKRKRTVRPVTPDGPSKKPNIEGEVTSATLPGSDESQSPDIFRCLSCFSFFIPTGCSFNIFRIFGRRDVDGQLDVLPPPASEDTPPRSENCTSWLLSCFQPGDSSNQPAPSDPATVPLLSSSTGAHSSDNTTKITASSTSYVSHSHSHGTVVKPEQSTVESPSGNQPAADRATIPLLSETQSPNGTTTTTEDSASYVRETHGTVVRPEHSTVGSSSEHQTTTTTTTTITTETATSSSTTTSEAATTQTSSATETFHKDVMEVITGEMPALKPTSGAIMEGTQHLLGHEVVHGPATTTFLNGSSATHGNGKVNIQNVKNMARGDMPTLPNPQPADQPHIVLPVFEGVNQLAPRPQQQDDWDILKAIVYGGLVESVTSLSLVSAAASSGAKTLDIFILGIANLIGGLPLIFHNIADLRDIRDVDGEDEQVGHYWLQLGRRSKARLHMVMALLSYIVFGLLPPVLYGLSFRESNNRENKMMAVAGASLACIALLALGKAHVNRRPRTYFKTLMYYLTIAVSSSGLSYVAGMLITRLLVQYGIIEQGGSAAPAPPGLSSPFAYAAGAETSAWASF